MLIQPNWNVFKTNANGNPQDYLEWFCYLLFCRDFNKKQGIHRYKNQAGIETDPIEVDQEVIGWQAKFYEVPLTNKKDKILEMLRSNRKRYPNLTTLYFYTNRQWSMTKSGKDPKAKVESEALARELKINLVWKPASFFESEFVTKQHWDIASHFFTPRTVSFQSVQKRYNTQLSDSEIKSKYIHEVHTVINPQLEILAHLGGEDLFRLVQYDFDDKYIPEAYEKFIGAVDKIRNGNELVDFPDLRGLLVDHLEDVYDIIIEAYHFTASMYLLLKQGEVYSAADPRAEQMIAYGKAVSLVNDQFTEIHRSDLISAFHKALHEKAEKAVDQKKQREENDALIELVNEPYYSFTDRLGRYIDHLAYHCEKLSRPSVYLHAAAGKGKTHVSFNIVAEHITNNKPAIFIKGKRLTSEEPLATQLLKALELSSNWTLDTYLSSLNLLGEWYAAKVPFIIDSIHESKFWSTLWKRDLGTLEGKIKEQYSNILLIVTYRTSYQEELVDLEKGYRHVQIRRDDSFDDDAVYAYFDYFKINLTTVGHASRMLYHPLYLRLFCETKNPKREIWMDCSAVKEDIFEIFEAYVSQRNKAICKLLQKRLSFNRSYLDAILLTLSEALYESSTRGVSISKLDLAENVLEALVSEDVLFLLEYNASDSAEEIQISYDLLAGYYIAKYLLQEYCIDRKSTIALFGDQSFRCRILESNHPLHEDILRSLLVLVIKHHQVFFWELPNQGKIQEFGVAAILDVNPTYLEGHRKYIQDTLKTRFVKKSAFAKQFLKETKGIRFDPRHPLNMQYISILLQKLDLADRDLIWTEYIRDQHGRYGDSKILEVLEGFKKIVTESNTESEERKLLYAYAAFWCLTSTIHDVRNSATQSLHYYFIAAPKQIEYFLNLSFTVNDNYVRERTLAAIYGAAMNMHGAFLTTQWVAPIAHWIYDKLFSPNAEQPSTHLLLRDYASGIIQLAISIEPTLLTPEQIARTQQPYPGMIHPEWKVVEEQEPINPESHSRPIHMDFENYTIGGLVPDRIKYHNDHPEFKEVLGKIYWRIYQLGYDINIFGKIDSGIENDQFRGRGRQEEGKIDRYGKKYSWIAYYEQAGCREDQGLLRTDYRMSDRRFAFDLDVSFPKKKPSLLSAELHNMVQFPHVIPDQNFKEWAITPPTEEQYNHLHLKRKVEGTSNEDWWLLYGGVSTITNYDSQPVYDRHIRSWLELVTPEQYQQLQQTANEHDDCSFPIFRLPDNYYVNIGEAYWREEKVVKIEKSDIWFNKRKVEKTNQTFRILQQGRTLDATQKQALDNKVMKVVRSQSNENNKPRFNLRKPKVSVISDRSFTLVDRDDYYRIVRSLGYNVQISENTFYEDEHDTITVEYHLPFHHYRNESQHAKTPPGLLITPALDICRQFDLRVSNQDRCMRTPNGAYATIVIDEGNHNQTGTQLAYIRKDLIQWYTKKQNLVPVWYQWCEKRYFEKGFSMKMHDGVSHVATHYRMVLDNGHQFKPKLDSSEEN